MANPTPTAAPTQAAPQSNQGTTTKTPQNAQSPTTTPQPTPAEIRKLKLKLEGQEVELPESEVIALAQKGKTADKRFQESAETRRRAEEIIKFAQENPREFFARTGKNARQWAEEFLMEEIKKEQMTPEQKKAADNEAELKKYRDQEKADKERADKEREQALEQQHMQSFDKLFVDALMKSGLPKTPWTVRRMAQLQLVNMKKKLDLNADQLAKVVREDYIEEQKALFGAADGPQLLEILGPEIVKKLSKAQIAKLKAKQIKPSAPQKIQSNDQQMTWREFQRRNRRLPIR